MKKLLLILFIPCTLWSQTKIIDIHGAKFKGMITNYEGVNLSDEYVIDARNVLFDEDLGPIKRKGYTRDNAVSFGSQSVSGLWQFVTSGGNEYLLAVSSNTFRYSIGGSTYTTIFSTLTLGYQVEGASAFNRFWFTSSTQSGYIDSDLINRDTVADFPKGTFIVKHVNRIWVAGVNNNRSILYASKFLNGDNWTLGGNAGDPAQYTIGLNDGDVITGIFPYKDALVIFKRRSIWMITGKTQNDFQTINLSNEIGCIQGRSIKEKQGKLYWLSHRGIEKMEEGAIVPFFSHPIKNLVSNIVSGYDVTTLRSVEDTNQADFLLGFSSYTDAYASIGSISVASNSIDSASFYTLGTSSFNRFTSSVPIAQSFIPQLNTNIIACAVRWYFNAGDNSFNANLYDHAADDRPGNTVGPTLTKANSLNPPSNNSWNESRLVFNPPFALVSGTTYWLGFTPTSLAQISIGSDTIPGGGYFPRQGSDGLPSDYIRSQSDILIKIKFSSAQFVSEVKDLGANVARFSFFKTNTTLNDGKITFFTRSGASPQATQSAAWTAQSIGAIIAASVNRYVQWRADFDIFFDSHNPTIQDVTMEYFDSSSKQNVASWIFEDRYLLAATTNTTSGSINDMVVVVDKFDNFTKYFNINALSFAEAFEKLYFGSSLSTGGKSGLINRFTNNLNDNNEIIDSFIETKDYCGDNCDSEKIFDKLYIKTKNAKTGGGVLTTQFQFDKDEIFTNLGDVSLTEKTGLIISKVVFPFGTGGARGRTIRFKFGNNEANQDFRFYGAKVYYNEFPVD